MKAKDRNDSKELYREMRSLPWRQLWDKEVARFEAAPPGGRDKLVGIIRAVGVVFAEFERPEEKGKVHQWLTRLLDDPSEKVRRYAIAALPKIGAESHDETKLLAALGSATEDREKKHLQIAISKIGGRTALEAAVLGDAEQKVKASVQRTENPSALQTSAVLNDISGVTIVLRARDGFERFIADEAAQHSAKFRVGKIETGCVALTPLKPFSIADLCQMRCFDDLSFAIAAGGENDLARSITSPLSLRILYAFTAGAIRYRLNFADKGHQRSAVERLANQVYALCPEILNDARSVTWTVDIRGREVELRPNLTPDPRFSYRQRDIPAASYPPLAAALARLAAPANRDVVWDPFCGSGMELVECALLGAGAIFGTDQSPDAIRIAQNNFAAAKLSGKSANFFCGDFCDMATKHFKPGTASIIITNPPMGRRVPVKDLQRLIEELFRVAATALKPGGRLVLANPVSLKPPAALKLQFEQKIDLGGIACRVEKYTHA